MKKIAVGSFLMLVSLAVMSVTAGVRNASANPWTSPSLKFPKTLPSIPISRHEFVGIVTDKGQGYTVPQFDLLLRPGLHMTEPPVEVSKDFPDFEAVSPQMPTFVKFPSWKKLHGVDIPKWDPPGSVILPPQGGDCPGGCDPGEGEWGLQYYGPAGSEDPVLSDTEVTIVFGEDGVLYGCAGCNQYFASYELGPDNSLEIGLIGSTMMWCGEEVMEQEGEYLGALADASEYTIEDGHLLVYYDDGNSVLIFEE